MAEPSPTVTVVVTSYRRPHALENCLEGLRAQRHRPDELVVVLHASDEASAIAMERWPEVRVVAVTESGSVAALNAGLKAATGTLVALVDDDAIPVPEWLERIKATFAQDPRIAAVGGRDVVHTSGKILGRDDQGFLGRFRGAPAVGRIQWSGRHIGNHHIGEGAARDVDVLKGANMAFRRDAVAAHGYDERLRGPGAQPHSELSICLPLRRRGLRLVYDPAIVVHHHPAPRPAGDSRVISDHDAVYDWTYNEALQLLDHLTPPRRAAFAAWGLLVGTKRAPGLVSLARHGLAGRRAWTCFRAAQQARRDAWRTHRHTPRQSFALREADPTITVVVTTYRRTRTLGPCLDALAAQTRPPDDVVVVVHASDDESAPFVDARAAEWPQLRRVTVTPPGLVAALNRGLLAATEEIVAFVDDDAIPELDWVERLHSHYVRDGALAGVGGRDVISVDGHIRNRGDEGVLVRTFGPPHVGRIQWFGRMLGNHHIGVGGARDVDVLKGVNMSFRRTDVVAHGFDDRLRGRGVEVHSELSICLPLRRRGLRLLYDPSIVVRHYPQSRGFGREREDVSGEAIRDAAHNEGLQLLDYFSLSQRVVFSLWGFGVGTYDAPGLANLIRHAATGIARPWTRFTSTQSGRLDAWKSHKADRQSRSTQEENQRASALH
ncbi:glycosyltransferase [Solirubrobacter ginsenosidimutans]|uniref:Glycosyltransferase n=1 Tax=Solirubrobacter ginsenosidimutans TaxID=490573 RepID=A0A9X3S3X8_9ACTN|nr:glycosyltransferase [Solirubrobacter ginsenosidimutans]MDA0163877.1 glycosyltransferase [Solirubrobacter ginsenosidimutans]